MPSDKPINNDNYENAYYFINAHTLKYLGYPSISE